MGEFWMALLRECSGEQFRRGLLLTEFLFSSTQLFSFWNTAASFFLRFRYAWQFTRGANSRSLLKGTNDMASLYSSRLLSFNLCEPPTTYRWGWARRCV